MRNTLRALAVVALVSGCAFTSNAPPVDARYFSIDPPRPTTLHSATQTVTASYFDGFTSTSTTLLSNAPLAAPMANLDRLFFESTPGESNAKNWAVDDFAMSTTVPAPASMPVESRPASFRCRSPCHAGIRRDGAGVRREWSRRQPRHRGLAGPQRPGAGARATASRTARARAGRGTGDR